MILPLKYYTTIICVGFTLWRESQAQGPHSKGAGQQLSKPDQDATDMTWTNSTLERFTKFLGHEITKGRQYYNKNTIVIHNQLFTDIEDYILKLNHTAKGRTDSTLKRFAKFLGHKVRKGN